MKYRKLTKREIERIASHDRVFHGGDGTLVSAFAERQNRTRIYKFLVAEPRSGDIQVRAVACVTRRNGAIAVKEIVRMSADSRHFWIKDLAFGVMSGYTVDWSPEGAGRKREWSYDGKWEREEYNRNQTQWRMVCHPVVINPEVLKDSPRFRWCAWTPECGDVLDYLKLYKDHPRLEMLSKAGLGRFARTAGFVVRLERNRELLQFVSRNLAEIRDNPAVGVREIDTARRIGCTLAEALARTNAAREFAGRDLHGVDAYRAHLYVHGQKGMTSWEYGCYLDQCAKLGLKMDDTKVVFPRHGHARALAVRRQWQEKIDRERAARDKAFAKERRARNRRLNAQLAARAKAFCGVAEKVAGGLCVHFPQSARDFQREGKALHHCVGDTGYDRKMAAGESILVFVRRADRPAAPFVTVELDGKTGKVLQCRGDNNADPDAAVRAFVEKMVAPACAKIARREARKGWAAGAAEPETDNQERVG